MKNPKKEQKIIIEKDGSVYIEWINAEFSDTILDIMPEKDKKQIKDINDKFGIKDPKIFCG